MKKLNSRKAVLAVSVICVGIAIAAPAQTFNDLANFYGPNGANPESVPIQGSDGNLYGTTHGGGRYQDGTLFRMTTGGDLATLSIRGDDGGNPLGNLVLDIDGSFYGTAFSGGTNAVGTIFRVSSQGKLTTLYNFCSLSQCKDGRGPYVGLTLGNDGDLYGTTDMGGDPNCSAPYGCGTVFKIDAAGILTTLHTFEGPDGSAPQGSLVEAVDGTFYGTTAGGGDLTCQPSPGAGCGTVFELSPNGQRFSTVHTFEASDGNSPSGSVALASDGNLYGTANLGGDVACNPPFGCGTVFKINSSGVATTLHTFESTDGSFPRGGVIQATDGNLYGTTSSGGDPICSPNGCGTVFNISPDGTLTTLHQFDGTDGSEPFAALGQATSGSFYGTTNGGGSDGDGFVYALSTGLGPFVAFVRAAGKVGQTGGILGQGFTGTNAVSLNGTPAPFTVISDTFIKA